MNGAIDYCDGCECSSPEICHWSRQEPRLTAEQLQDVHDIIRSISVSRGAVDSSTPEQIVWLTVKAIEDNLIAYARGEDSKYRWLPTTWGVVADIRRSIDQMKIGDKIKARVLAQVDRAVSGWPA